MLIRQKGTPTPYLPVPFPILSTFLPPWVKWGGWWGPQTWRISVLAVLAPWVSHVANVWSKQSHQNSDNTHLFGYFLAPNVSPIHLHHWVIYIYIFFLFSLVKSAVPRKFSSMSHGLLTLLLTLWAIHPSFSWCMPMLTISGYPL